MEALPLEFSALLVGALTFLLTKLSEKLKVSKTWLSIGLSLIGGTVYYVVSNYYALERSALVGFVTQAYASSQLIYNLIKKAGVLETKSV